MGNILRLLIYYSINCYYKIIILWNFREALTNWMQTILLNTLRIKNNESRLTTSHPIVNFQNLTDIAPKSSIELSIPMERSDIQAEEVILKISS